MREMERQLEELEAARLELELRKPKPKEKKESNDVKSKRTPAAQVAKMSL